MVTRKTIRAKGFTLLEILIALAIFAWVSAASFTGLNSVLKTREVTAKAADKLQQTQLALTIIQRDFAQISNATSRDEYGDTQAGLTTQTTDQSLIKFTRNGWQNPARIQRSNFQRVSYVLEDDVLYREYYGYLNPGPQPKQIRSKLLENIEEVEFEFIDEERDTHEQWPTANQADPTRIPMAIRIIITTEEDIEIARTFNLQR